MVNNTIMIGYYYYWLLLVTQLIVDLYNNVYDYTHTGEHRELLHSGSSL